jgi:hypothetical protein
VHAESSLRERVGDEKETCSFAQADKNAATQLLYSHSSVAPHEIAFWSQLAMKKEARRPYWDF